MIGAIKVAFGAWLAMFFLVFGMRIALVSFKPPPLPNWLRVPFEFAHMTVAGLAGGWLCGRSNPESALLCGVLLAVICSGIELLSLRLGWTTFELAHSVAAICAAPAAVILGALYWV